MHYLIRNGEDAGSLPVKRRSAKPAWSAARKLRQGGRNIAILDREGNFISALAATAADETVDLRCYVAGVRRGG